MKEEPNPFKKPLEKIMLNNDKTLTKEGKIILIMASFSLTRGIIKLIANKNKYKKIKY